MKTVQRDNDFFFSSSPLKLPGSTLAGVGGKRRGGVEDGEAGGEEKEEEGGRVKRGEDDSRPVPLWF